MLQSWNVTIALPETFSIYNKAFYCSVFFKTLFSQPMHHFRWLQTAAFAALVYYRDTWICRSNYICGNFFNGANNIRASLMKLEFLIMYCSLGICFIDHFLLNLENKFHLVFKSKGIYFS